MQEKNKWLFWALVAAALLVTCIPSTVLLRSFSRYRRFLEGYEPVPLKPRSTRFIPHPGNRSRPMESRLRFVEFRLHAPRAKSVNLIGDFNSWREATHPMARQSSGVWELLLPLPPGRYRYQFVVDGETRTDPGGVATGEKDGRKASVKVVP